MLQSGVPWGEGTLTAELPQDVPAFLVMTGGEGCGNASALTEALLDRLENRQARIVVLAGRNKSLRDEIACRFGGDERVLALPFTDRVELFMSACDVLLTKPGGISSTEAAVHGTALIHTAPIPGCETINARFFSERFMSILAPDEQAAAQSAVRLAEDPAQRERMLSAQAQYIDPLAAERIAQRIISDHQG